MWRQKNVLYSVMNVGPESSERNTRFPYTRIMADVLYNVLRTRICLVQQYSRIVIGWSYAPLVREILSLNAKTSKSSKSSKPPPGVYYHWLQSCTRPCQSIFHSSKNFAGCTVNPSLVKFQF
ncbi:hypothetical protein VN97_g5539 [Penicillium thymicola]|uniref:Uncharacterized protein n=1 Tax=Penicillium thymicola TaxID=293382 RepID=A0AAI9TJA1_PENTH|nr:hypothetical protein VN97_g5539 [Penicillium thymicola]